MTDSLYSSRKDRIKESMAQAMAAHQMLFNGNNGTTSGSMPSGVKPTRATMIRHATMRAGGSSVGGTNAVGNPLAGTTGVSGAVPNESLLSTRQTMHRGTQFGTSGKGARLSIVVPPSGSGSGSNNGTSIAQRLTAADIISNLGGPATSTTTTARDGGRDLSVGASGHHHVHGSIDVQSHLMHASGGVVPQDTLSFPSVDNNNSFLDSSIASSIRVAGSLLSTQNNNNNNNSSQRQTRTTSTPNSNNNNNNSTKTTKKSRKLAAQDAMVVNSFERVIRIVESLRNEFHSFEFEGGSLMKRKMKDSERYGYLLLVS